MMRKMDSNTNKETDMSNKMRTGVIRYNITNRNRKYSGQPRNFNLSKVVSLINSDSVQEMVQKGDMIGYLGHGVRSEFGLMPQEMGMTANTEGKLQLIPIEPCIRTISIKAYDDGTIEHQAEFIDNQFGRTAWEWFKNKLGGFSSVFSPTTENPTGFYGFDYVRIPNYDSNRGYVADSIMFDLQDDDKRLTLKQREAIKQVRLEEKAAIMDCITQKYTFMQEKMVKDQEINKKLNDQLQNLQAAFDSAQKDNAVLKASISSLEYENSRLSMPPEKTQPEHQPSIRLDINKCVMDSAQKPMARLSVNDSDSNTAGTDSGRSTTYRLNSDNEFKDTAAIMDSLTEIASDINRPTPTEQTSSQMVDKINKAFYSV